MKILIVEDNFYIVSRILKELSFSDKLPKDTLITVTSTLDEAEKLVDFNYDILLMDHDLPDGSGWIFLNNQKNKFKGKIIGISAVPENNQRLLNHGAQVAVNKMDSNFLELLLIEILN